MFPTMQKNLLLKELIILFLQIHLTWPLLSEDQLASITN
jgi:hypothetical protein